MTNLEFYKEEIKAKYKHNERLSNNTLSEDIANALFDVWTNYSDRKIDMMDWLFEEHEEPILNNAEREYLSNVIKPFRNYEIAITKEKGQGDFEYLKLCIYKINDWNSVTYFPPFIKNTIYKNMKLDKKYTAEELGL